MSTTSIYVTGDGLQQYARRDDGVWFVRVRRVNAPGWAAWRVHGRNNPNGLYRDPHASMARLPARRNNWNSNTQSARTPWYLAD